MTGYKQRLKQAVDILKSTENIIIGAGAGLSAAAGLDYSGKRFNDAFADFRKKYGVKDMYSASFYPFETQEEFWAQWARHIFVNRFDMPPTELYKSLYQLVNKKNYFVITTNVESQFEKSGFPKEKIYEVQGNYAYFQCAKSCHKKLYFNESLVIEMNDQTEDCKIPSRLIPKCPACGGKMDVNVRHNNYFVEDEYWYTAQQNYNDYLKNISRKPAVFLELGVGFNTPGIIRYPFEQLVYHNPNAVLIRINRDYSQAIEENKDKTISFNEDMDKTINIFLEECKS